MSLVEQTARYLAPKYIAAYMDVLDLYLKSIGREELIDRELSYGVMLEFGLSTRTMISLTELGFSRMTAVEISDKIAKDDLDTVSVRKWLAQYESLLESMDVPSLIIREVRTRLETLK